MARGYRRRGLATRLLRKLIDEARRRELAAVEISVCDCQPATLDFYQRLGFRRTPSSQDPPVANRDKKKRTLSPSSPWSCGSATNAAMKPKRVRKSPGGSPSCGCNEQHLQRRRSTKRRRAATNLRCGSMTQQCATLNEGVASIMLRCPAVGRRRTFPLLLPTRIYHILDHLSSRDGHRFHDSAHSAFNLSVTT